MRKQNEKALEQLMKYFYRKKYSNDTIKRWVITAVEFIAFLEKYDKTVDDVGDLLNSEGRVVQKELFGVRDYIDTKTKYSAGYVHYLHKVLKRFYIAWEKHFPIDNEDFPKDKGDPERKMFTTDQILKVQETARTIWVGRDKKNPGDIIGLRDYCVVLVAIDCGPRRTQICELNVENYNDLNGTLFIPKAKGGRDTIRALSDTTKNALRFYIVKRKQIDVDEKAMFLKKGDARVTKSCVSEMLVFTMKKAGVYETGFGFHSFRRAKCWRLKKAGFTEEQMNDVMGWKRGSKMSHIYGELDQTEIQNKATDADDIFKRRSKVAVD